MMQKRRSWPDLLAVAVVVACLGGCRHSGGPSQINALMDSGPTERVELTPSQLADVQIGYARSLEKRGEEEQALARYSEAVKQDPNRADAWMRLAMLHDRQGKFSDSTEMYSKALALKPGDPDIFCNVGYSFYLQQRWGEAEMNLRQAIAVRPNHARAHNNLALLLARTRRDEEALAEFRKGGCAPADAHVNLAFALTLERRWPEARGHYQQAMAADESCVAARQGLHRLEAVLAKASLRDPVVPGTGKDGCVPVSHRQAGGPTADPQGTR